MRVAALASWLAVGAGLPQSASAQAPPPEEAPPASLEPPPPLPLEPEPAQEPTPGSTSEPRPPASPAPVSPEAQVRLRLGAGVHAGQNSFSSGRLGDNIIGIAGLYGRLGMQWNDLFSLEAEAAGSYFLFSAYERGALLVGYTYHDWLGLNAGLALTRNYAFGLFGGRSDAFHLAPNARLDFMPWRGKAEDGTRRALSLGFTVEAGTTEVRNRPTTRSALGFYGSIGYAAY